LCCMACVYVCVYCFPHCACVRKTNKKRGRESKSSEKVSTILCIICMHAWVCMCMWVRMYVKCVYMYVCEKVRHCGFVFAYTHTRIHSYTHSSTCIHAYVHTYTHTLIRIQYIRSHTHEHTRIYSQAYTDTVTTTRVRNSWINREQSEKFLN